MKKVFILLLTISLSAGFTSCKSDKKETTATESEKKAAFSLKNATNEINFTAYKFTEKTPVGGQFRQVEITTGGSGNTIKEAINNAEFSIPVSSIFTKDSSRDYKIQKFFFGVMSNTKLLSGKLMIENDSIGSAMINMNGVSEKIPFKYTIVNNTFAMSATMDISNWKALDALASLNKVCEALHTGSDGISKTWSDVALNITSKF
ncbi:YceI family protein [Polaribacter sp. PL03]|uniref:YceI family protein n=1 Tax=Polaribacter sp. PL03 TaxID=3088353 RepID=UPI0029D20B80|nr:YceI family protein [Polaribacter sp. PL03]MDX6746813.1 YceI family protein [Polaribacter sp. PL03]